MASQELVSTHRHVAHFYSDLSDCDRQVVTWIRPALVAGGGAILVCTPANAARLRAGLEATGVDPRPLEQAGRLLIVRARDLMDRFMGPEGPRGDVFHRLAKDLLVKVRVGCPDRSAPVRVWGEMVHLLWDGGQPEAAHRLEMLWNEALPERGVELLCSYDVAGASEEACAALRQDVLLTHGHLLA